MNIRLLKKIGLSTLLALCVASNAFAQTKPPTGAAPNPPNVPARNIAWPYTAPGAGATATPSIEMSSAYYLPYLPWMGQMLAMLVNYADASYQMQQSDVTNSGGNSPYSTFTAGTLSANNILGSTMDSNAEAARADTESTFQKNFSFFPQTANLTTALNTPGTDITIPCSPNSANCTSPTNEQFNADALLGVMGYPADAQNNMDTLITFLGNFIQPLPNPGFAEGDLPDDRAKFLQRGDVQSYILSLRVAGALQSMALSNFNILAQERLIKKGLGDQVNMTNFPLSGQPTPIHDASQLQIEKFLIDRRVNNKDWYAAMNNAPSIVLQREMVFILAETQRQLFDLRMLNERLLATMSTMQMAMLQMGNSALGVQAESIKQKIEAAKNPPPAPPPPTPPPS